MKSIVIVIPIYNEEKSIVDNLSVILKHARLQRVANVEILLVDDGSTDGTLVQIQAFSEKNCDVQLLCLNRNFGKEAAIYAGLNRSRHRDAVIVMDSDLQHPPMLIEKMIHLWMNEGYEVVEACKKVRGQESLGRKISAQCYYRLFEYLSGLDMNGHSDYKLLDKKVVKEYCDLPEKDRFFRGLIDWMQFETAQIYFDVPFCPNNMSSWTRLKLMKYAISSITSFTSSPLHLVTLLGGLTFFISIVVGGMTLYQKILGNAVDGFATVILLILLVGSVLMLGLGIIGVYLAKIYDEIKERPTYLIDSKNSRITDE